MPETYPDYPRHDLILDCVRAFAKQHDLERSITFGVRVEAATRLDAGGWTIALSNGDSRACSALCVATGTTWQPRVPQVPGQFAGRVCTTSFNYRSPKEFEGKRVLIVGGGNSGADIACDAARHAKRAFISLRRGYYFIPKFIFGQETQVPQDAPRHGRLLEERHQPQPPAAARARQHVEGADDDRRGPASIAREVMHAPPPNPNSGAECGGLATFR